LAIIACVLMLLVQLPFMLLNKRNQKKEELEK
jgi:hypothetical protein